MLDSRILCTTQLHFLLPLMLSIQKTFNADDALLTRILLFCVNFEAFMDHFSCQQLVDSGISGIAKMSVTMQECAHNNLCHTNCKITTTTFPIFTLGQVCEVCLVYSRVLNPSAGKVMWRGNFFCRCVSSFVCLFFVYFPELSICFLL